MYSFSISESAVHFRSRLIAYGPCLINIMKKLYTSMTKIIVHDFNSYFRQST